MKRINTILLGFVLLLSAQGDRVVFKNGRILDCTIVAEGTHSVKISLGTGSIQIPRDQLTRVERTKSTKGMPTRSGNILSAEHAPKAHAKLAADFRKLMMQRNAAGDAQDLMARYTREITQLEKKVKKLDDALRIRQNQLAEVNRQNADLELPERTPYSPSEVRKYNMMVVLKQRLNDQSRALYSQLVPFQEKKRKTLALIPELREKYKQAMQPIPIYHRELRNFSIRYAKYKRKINLKTADADTQALFKKMDRYLTQFKKEMPSVGIQSKRMGHSTMVQVLVNGTTLGEFIFDTGATTMTISESFAKRLNLSLSAFPTTQMIVADGRRVAVKTTRLRSVSVGGLEIINVEVLIVPDSPNTTEDGLLGMSFLKHFAVGINGATGKIELTRFMPSL